MIGIFCACMPAIAGPFAHFFKKFTSSIGASWSLTRTRSKFTGGSMGSESAKRVPSSTTEHSLTTQRSGGGISKTVESSMYHIPNDARSDDDVELVSREHERHGPLETIQIDRRSFGHEYAGQWK